MSDAPQYPSAPRTPDEYSTAPVGEAPRSIQNAVKVVFGLIGLYVLNVIITFLTADQLIEQMRESNPEVGEVGTGTIAVTSIVSLVIFGGLYLLLAHFLRRGASWARIVLTVLAVLGLLGALFSIFTAGSALLMIVSVIQAALTAALLYFMWQKDASAYIQGQTR